MTQVQNIGVDARASFVLSEAAIPQACRLTDPEVRFCSSSIQLCTLSKELKRLICVYLMFVLILSLLHPAHFQTGSCLCQKHIYWQNGAGVREGGIAGKGGNVFTTPFK